MDDITDPRTGLAELSEAACWELLRTHAIGRLAVTVGTTPDIFPVNYVVHDGAIVVRTEAGTKLAAATLMPAVAFEIDSFDTEGRTGWSVVVKGHGREPVRLEDVLDLDELGLEPWAGGSKSRWLVIAPREVTGRRIPSPVAADRLGDEPRPADRVGIRPNAIASGEEPVRREVAHAHVDQVRR